MHPNDGDWLVKSENAGSGSLIHLANIVRIIRAIKDVISFLHIFQYVLKDISPIVLRLFPVSFCSPDLLTTVDEVSIHGSSFFE